MRVKTKVGPGFYVECVNHMCRLDHSLDQFKKSQDQGVCAAKLTEVRSMLVQIVDFTESRFAPETFQQLSAQAAELNANTRQLSKLVSSQSWNSVKRLLGSKADATIQINTRYNTLQTDFMKFVVEHLVECVKLFDRSDDRQSYLESIDTFSTELSKVW